MKFKTGDRVQKVSGYKFMGTVVSAYEIVAGIRYNVQLNNDEVRVMFADFVHMLGEQGIQDHGLFADVDNALMNGHGMIHIFSEEQLELVD